MNTPETPELTYEERMAAARPEYEAKHGQVWTTAEMQAEFTVMGFAAPYVVVTRKSDGKVGSLQFTHSPRFYFKWEEDKS